MQQIVFNKKVKQGTAGIHKVSLIEPSKTYDSW